MDKVERIWASLQDKEYRREFASDVGTGLAFQIKMLREKNGWTQEHLAHRTGKKQETISQWENPTYGSYTLNSLKSLAAAFDVALMVKFVPFRELINWTANLTPERLAPKSYEEENSVAYEEEDSVAMEQLPAYSFPLGLDAGVSMIATAQGDFLEANSTLAAVTANIDKAKPAAADFMILDEASNEGAYEGTGQRPEGAGSLATAA